MVRSVTFIALLSLATPCAASALLAQPQSPPVRVTPGASDDTLPALTLDPAIVAMAHAVDPNRLRADDTALVGFGTRNLFSETLDSKTRGVFAARDWIVRQFDDDAKGSDGRMTVALDTYLLQKTATTPRAVTVSGVYAVLRGDDPNRATYVMSSHYDSRNSDGNDALLDAPGADDNGSATSAVLEAARIMGSRHFFGTIVFACFDGEEQGLFGSAHFAKTLAERGVHVGADFNNDIIGASVGHDGASRPDVVRLFSEALPASADLARVNLVGSENDSPSRELARFTSGVDAAYEPQMRVETIYRSDRFLRGGDQQSFAAQGFPAVRFVEASETFDHQHQTLRTENGIRYGDTLDHVDFDYVASVTRLNIVALATIALAPERPAVTMDVSKLGYDTTLRWDAVPRAASYDVLWRTTDASQWQHATNVTTTSATIPLSKDDYIFGVRSVDAAGHRSVATYPTPMR